METRPYKIGREREPRGSNNIAVDHSLWCGELEATKAIRGNTFFIIISKHTHETKNDIRGGSSRKNGPCFPPIENHNVFLFRGVLFICPLGTTEISGSKRVRPAKLQSVF